MAIENFSPSEIPYESLAHFGITQEMIDDLPQSVMTALLSGRPTPIIPITATDEELGENRSAFARITLNRTKDENGEEKVVPVYIPVWKEKDLSGFTEEEQRELTNGNVIIFDHPEEGRSYAQLDEALNQVVSSSYLMIKNNLDLLRNEVALSDSDYNTLLEGKVIELFPGSDEPMSFGVDLMSPKGWRFATGDALAWKEEREISLLPKHNFGLYGCWIKDDRDFLTYIKEEDYTPEMKEELERAGIQNQVNANLRSSLKI